MHGKQHEHGADADMRTGEGCRGTLAGLMGMLNEVIEQSVGPAWTGEPLAMVHEIVAHVGEDASCHLVETNGSVVVLRAGDGQEDEDDVVEHERGKHYPRGSCQFLGATEEIVGQHHKHHGEITGVAQVHQFAEDGVADGLREEQGRLTTKELLLPGGKEMVEIREDAVQLVSVGIPP